MTDRLFILMQYLVPQHLLSRIVGMVGRCRLKPVKGLFIRWFIGRYGVDMNEAAQPDPAEYDSFIDFFTRPLKAGIRPLVGDETMPVSPVDGEVSQAGRLEDDLLLQAKGRQYSLRDLLGDDRHTETFCNGSFVTLYLAPGDYHRIHMPMAGTLTGMRYVPGSLFSVNHTTAQHVPGLFARNERVVCFFDTDLGPMAMVLVGAMIVAGIETVWSGEVCPAARGPFFKDYRDYSPAVQLGRGAEMGRFKLGSTVIVMFGPDAITFNERLKHGERVRMGQALV